MSGLEWDLTRPCADCPFRREGGVRLRSERTREIAEYALGPGGATFACHKTTGVGGEYKDGKQRQCAGALVFAEKNDAPTQMMRICGRLGFYDPNKLEGFDDVFDDVDEMLEASED